MAKARSKATSGRAVKKSGTAKSGMDAVQKAAAKKAAAKEFASKQAALAAKEPSEKEGDCGKKIRCRSLTIDGTKYRTRLNQKYEKRRKWEIPDPRKVMSVIPGTVLKINVKEGQEVAPGDQLLILEAMKMKNKILVHLEGKVKSIHVKEGERVPKDFLMLELS